MRIDLKVKGKPALIRRLKSLRKQLKVSQDKMARMIGISMRTYVRWELGESLPSDMAIEKIEAFILGQSDSPGYQKEE